MKVLQLGKFYPIYGGVEKVMFDLAIGLSKRGHQCDMLCSSLDNEMEDVIINENCKIIRTKSIFKIAATTISPSMIFKLRQICNDYDIIHIHHPDPMAGIALFFSGFRGKVILHWHSDIYKQKKLLYLYLPFQKWLINRADVIVGTTPVYIKNSSFLKHVQYKTTYLPIGIDQFIPNQESVENIQKSYPNKKIIFSVGRLVEYKGYKYLIDAAKYLDDDYVILIAGNGPLKNELQKNIIENGLSDKVKLLGFISNEEKYAYFEACKIFCLSSIQKNEAFAIVQIEAMSCSKPVVSTNIIGSGVPWVNKHGESGIVVDTENGLEIANAITQICEDKQIYKQLCSQAKNRYETLFTKHNMMDKCLSIYTNIFTKIITESKEQQYETQIKPIIEKAI